MNWINVRRPLTADDLKKLEKELDISLPEDYLELIGPINGGALKDAYIYHSNYEEIPYSRNVPLDKESPGNIFQLYNENSPRDMTLFPFASVGNGDYFCFDLKNGTVVLWFHETNQAECICDNFTELMKKLE